MTLFDFEMFTQDFIHGGLFFLTGIVMMKIKAVSQDTVSDSQCFDKV